MFMIFKVIIQKTNKTGIVLKDIMFIEVKSFYSNWKLNFYIIIALKFYSSHLTFLCWFNVLYAVGFSAGSREEQIGRGHSDDHSGPRGQAEAERDRQVAGHVHRVPVSPWQRGPAAERHVHFGRTEKAVVFSQKGFKIFVTLHLVLFAK